MPVFDDYAAYYDLLYNDKDYHSEVEYISSLIEKIGIKAAGSLLDIGCGTGKHAAEFIECGYEVFGVDLSSEMLRIAKENVPNCKFKRGRAEDFTIRQAIWYSSIALSRDELSNFKQRTL